MSNKYPIKIGEEAPIMGKLKEHFPNINDDTIVVAYNGCIYTRRPIPNHLYVHESVHLDRQGNNPDEWWEKYINDISFRISEEVCAYREQYFHYAKNHKDPNKQKIFGMKLARELASDLYGLHISIDTAFRMITTIFL